MTPLTGHMFSHPPLGGPYGPTGQAGSAPNSNPGAVTYIGAGGIYPSPDPGDYTAAPHEGIRVGEIEAWRAWCVRYGYLMAITADLIWAPGDIVHGDTKVHGIHAFKTPSEAMTYVKGWCGPFVIGRVDLWGEVTEHESGYRAEFAKPMSIEFVVEGKIPDSDLAALRERYGMTDKRAA